ncbi:MAG: CHAP domain-containing protein [Actinomycetota bacterium]|nr:CHAP domain-containing protein [Actinomycetota bacterium]
MASGGHHRGRTAARLVALLGACVLVECLAVPAALATPSPATVGVQPSDVPGYAPVPPTLTSITSTTLPAALRSCAGASPLLDQVGTGPAATTGELYGQGLGPFGVPALLAGSVVLTDGNATDAQQAFTMLTSSTLQSCWLSTYRTITTALVSGLATLLTAHQAPLPALSLGSNVQSTGFAFHVTASALGQTVTDSIGITAIRVGTIVALLFTLGTNQTFPETLRASVARDIALRMGASAQAPTSPVAPTPSQPTTPRFCLRSGIPHDKKPVLTDAQVGAIVHGRVQFTVEITHGSSTCVWTETMRSRVSSGTAVGALTTTWRVLVDGPLRSATAARAAYERARASASLAVTLTHLGDAAALISTPSPSPMAAVLVRAGRYYLELSSATATASPTETAILQGLATAVLVRLGAVSSRSSKKLRRKTWPTDWADAAFCHSYRQPVLATFRGVASCGERYVNTESNTNPKPICYPASRCKPPGVLFDTGGFQCVEYADRYFYYMTGIGTFPFDPGSDTAEALYFKFHGTNPQLGLVPPGALGGTSTFEPSLAKGDIISMWRPGYTVAFGTPDLTGHVAVVTSVRVKKEKNGRYAGQITMINQNAQGGITSIQVRTSVLSYGGGYFTKFQWLTGLPTS